MAKKKAQTAKTSDVLGALNEIAPFRLAESWDNVGLQIGAPDRAVKSILVALEVTPDVIAEASRRKAQLVVTHHPLIFTPLKTLNESAPVPRMVAEMVRKDIGLIAAHTNLDSVAEGTNGEIADRLDLQKRRFLLPAPNAADEVKYVVFVPTSHVDAVIDAAAKAGAGVIGDYSHCTFRSPGTGTFIPQEGANPYVGKRGELEQATDEVRLEVVCPKARLGRLIEAVREAHPYEEAAFDVYPLEPDPEPRHGLGLVGKLKKPATLDAFVKACKRAFSVKSAGVVGDGSREIRRVAICSGAGGEAIRRWRLGTADVLVTGEMTHHQCAEARDKGVAVVLVGHYASEVIVNGRLARMLAEHSALKGKEVEVIVSEDECDPLARV